MKNPAGLERGSRATVATAADIRRRAVRELLVDHDLGVNDAARQLGIAAATVIRDRDALGIPARPRGGRRAQRAGQVAVAVVIYRCRECRTPQPRERLCDKCAHPLRAARIAAGMSQRRLGELIGSTQTAINSIEQRQKGVSPERAAKIAAALGRAVEDIFGDLSSYDGRPWLAQEREREHDVLRSYCDRHGYLTLADASAVTACSGYVLISLLRARRYPGPWTSGGRPWLVRVADLDTVPQLLEQRRAERSVNHALENTRRHSDPNGMYRNQERLRKISVAMSATIAGWSKRRRAEHVVKVAEGRKDYRPFSGSVTRRWKNRVNIQKPMDDGRRPVDGRRPERERDPEWAAKRQKVLDACARNPMISEPALARVSGLKRNQVRLILAEDPGLQTKPRSLSKSV